MRIVVDSTCDLPTEVIQRHAIEVVPVFINIGDRGYQDGIEITRERFYRELPGYSTFPRTAAPSPGQFKALYERLFDEGASGILSIHLSATLSSTVKMAAEAADSLTGKPVIVFDSGQLSLGAGFMAERAAMAFEEGWSADRVVAALQDQGERTYVLAVLQTLEFLRRSGRVSSLMAGLGSLLSLKPLLKMHAGVATSERVRTRKRAVERLVGTVEMLAPLERLALVHASAPEQAEELRSALAEMLPGGPVPSVEITPVIGAHVGPGVVGVVCVASKPLTAADHQNVMG